MGNCFTDTVPAADRRRDRTLDRELRSQKKKTIVEVKILLLGAGASGKSTIAKQMKIMFKNGYNDEERAVFTELVYFNVVTAIRVLLDGAKSFGYTIKPENHEIAEAICSEGLQLAEVRINAERATAIKELWTDPAIQKTFEKASTLQLDDSAEYFIKNVERIGHPEYLPTDQDILKVRAKTTGIIETKFPVKGLSFRMIDVGGQRNERKKWIHCFEEVTAIIFVCAISGYNLRLEEDTKVNRMKESMSLFEDTINNKWFKHVNVILFLNKIDIFERKILKYPFSDVFTDFEQPSFPSKDDQKAVKEFYQKHIKFIESKFKALNKTTDERLRALYIHQTCATDTESVRIVFEAVQDIFLTDSLREAGFGMMGVPQI